MSLNISKGNMYDFITHTWNVIKGECYHDCSYCYMKRWGKLNPVRFDEKELKTDLGKDNFIFVGSSCDMFNEYIHNHHFGYILDILDYCRKFDNKYLFQTKNPFIIYDTYVLPKNSIICTTLETDHFYKSIMNNAPNPAARSAYMGLLSQQYKTFVTIEPILNFNLGRFVELIKNCNPEQVNIGADSGGHNLPEPPKEKILELMSELEKFTKVKQKKNLNRLLK